MPIDYNPKDAMCWPEGDYEAVLLKVEDKTSQRKPDGSGGNPMQVWTVEVYSPGGKKQTISDYMVIPTGTYKIKQLAMALDCEEEFNAAAFQAEDHINSNFFVHLVISQQPGFEDKNKITKYKKEADAPKNGAATTTSGSRKPSPQPAEAPFGSEKVFDEDSIPF